MRFFFFFDIETGLIGRLLMVVNLIINNYRLKRQ